MAFNINRLSTAATVAVYYQIAMVFANQNKINFNAYFEVTVGLALKKKKARHRLLSSYFHQWQRSLYFHVYTAIILDNRQAAQWI